MGPWLDNYPRSEAAATLQDGFTHGFFIPFNLSWSPVLADNLRSARDLPEVLREKVGKEVSAGRLAGPFLVPPFSNLRVFPLGVVPKKEPGKFRLIHHLSYPKGDSVNYGRRPPFLACLLTGRLVWFGPMVGGLSLLSLI